MEIIGQEKLINKLNSYTVQTLPKASIFFGESGCGKHYIGKYLADRLDLDLVIIEPKITYDQLIEFSQNPVSTLYVIDLRGIAEKQQNQFLKFVEEPISSAYFILLADSEIGILPTLCNRCQKFYFEPYSVDQLRKITNNRYNSELPYLICRTPGQLENLDEKALISLQAVCTKFLTSIKQASYANLISLSTKINYKEEYNKYDFTLFFNVLEYVAYNNFIKTNNLDAFNIFKLTNEYKQQMFNRAVNKENYILNFLTAIWRLTR